MKSVEQIRQPIRQAVSCDGTHWSLNHMWSTDDALMIWRADPGEPMEQFFMIRNMRVAHFVFDIFVGTQRNSG